MSKCVSEWVFKPWRLKTCVQEWRSERGHAWVKQLSLRKWMGAWVSLWLSTWTCEWTLEANVKLLHSSNMFIIVKRRCTNIICDNTISIRRTIINNLFSRIITITLDHALHISIQSYSSSSSRPLEPVSQMLSNLSIYFSKKRTVVANFFTWNLDRIFGSMTSSIMQIDSPEVVIKVPPPRQIISS